MTVAQLVRHAINQGTFLKVFFLENLDLLAHRLQVMRVVSQVFVVLVHLLADILVPLDSGSMHLDHPGFQLIDLGFDSPESKQLSLQSITLKTESVSPNNNKWTGHLRTLSHSLTNNIHNRELVAAVYRMDLVDASQGLSWAERSRVPKDNRQTSPHSSTGRDSFWLIR